ncbi:hypothetical protein BGW80DRAFT_1292460, partial [Lactifluus volemus]
DVTRDCDYTRRTCDRCPSDASGLATTPTTRWLYKIQGISIEHEITYDRCNRRDGRFASTRLPSHSRVLRSRHISRYVLHLVLFLKCINAVPGILMNKLLDVIMSGFAAEVDAAAHDIDHEDQQTCIKY